VLAGGLVAGAATALVACGSGTPAEPSVPASGTGTVAAATARLPVGAAISVKVEGKEYLLFRPAEDKVLAYTAVCTHQGCTVGIGTGDFACPCHGSRFSREDGTATHGPAKKPLARFPAKVDGDNILIYL
jgi:Rieske Fe-S protein